MEKGAIVLNFTQNTRTQDIHPVFRKDDILMKLSYQGKDGWQF